MWKHDLVFNVLLTKLLVQIRGSCLSLYQKGIVWFRSSRTYTEVLIACIRGACVWVAFQTHCFSIVIVVSFYSNSQENVHYFFKTSSERWSHSLLFSG